MFTFKARDFLVPEWKPLKEFCGRAVFESLFCLKSSSIRRTVNTAAVQQQGAEGRGFELSQG